MSLIIGHVNHEVHYSYMVGMIGIVPTHSECTEIDKKAWLFANLQPGRARKRINAT